MLKYEHTVKHGVINHANRNNEQFSIKSTIQLQQTTRYNTESYVNKTRPHLRRLCTH